ncbi:ATP-binding protein [Candidatus Parcubacteria bacterium]|nr:ATP-binding protein [Candidatus Parcubacteria bacterium]
MEYVPNEPNAAKLINSLRNTGYTSYAAIEDIIDNSIDADAKTIRVFVEHKNNELRVIIADDGIGMDEEVLDQALRLGSLTDREEMSDLGKYGMGLCTASISMARRLEVLTREKGGQLYYGAQDLDDVVSKNKFIKIQREANRTDENLFEGKIGAHGTVVVLSKVDRLSDSNVAQFATKLTRDLGRIYRKFIEAGVKFYVNEKKVEMSDPLWLNDKKTQIYSDEEYDLPRSITGGRKESIRVKIALLPEMSDALMKELKINIPSQGFYILRNNREIADGLSLGVFIKHGDFNRLRIELSFSASLDNEMGVRFSKDGVDPNQGITDLLKQELGGQIASIRKIVKRTQQADSSSSVDHSDSEAVIAKKAKLLIVPEAEIEKRSPRKNTSEKRTRKDGDDSITRTPHKTQLSPKGMGARFETESRGREGVLYECAQEGKVIVIRWNSDHPFYDQIVFPNKSSKGIISGLDYLIFALASAELKVTNDDNVELLGNVKSIMSSNLRALLS